MGHPPEGLYCGGSERNSYISELNYILDKVVCMGGNGRLIRANDFCAPIPISILVFLLASIISAFFSPDFLHSIMQTKINQSVLESSDYARLQISSFFGAIFSTILMAPYLLVRSSRNRIRYYKYLPANVVISFMGFLLCVIIGLNQAVFFDEGTRTGYFVIKSPVVYFIFIVLPILLYQFLFRYYFRK